MKVEYPEIPQELVRAHKDGRMALFVGAGVSVGYPSCLPLFDKLANCVDDRLGKSHACGRPEERLEKRVEQGFNVHGMVREIIKDSSGPNTTHEALAALAVAGPSIRVVTTNYDRHVSACLPEATRVYEAPDLPGDDNFTGLVHIHGSVMQDPERLVVTESDFARAYMQQYSPTLLFLRKLLASQTVLFVGYSLGDTLMRYLLYAYRGHTRLYALTHEPDSPRWGELGVIPLGYPSHDDLPAILGEWAKRSGASFEDHDRRVARIVSDTTVHGGLAQLEESYLSEIVSDPNLVRIFTKHARGPVWLRWMGTRPETKLFTLSAGRLDTAEKQLASWFVKHHNDDDSTAAEALRLIVQNRGHLHKFVWLNMVMAPNLRGGTDRETANKLMLTLADNAPAELSHCVLYLLKYCETPGDDDLFLELVDRGCRPQVSTPDPSRPSQEHLGPFQARIDDPFDQLRQSLDRGVWSRRQHLAGDLLSIVVGHLRRVHRIETIAGNPDPYDSRAATEDHHQDVGVHSADFLVDTARDLYQILATDSPETAASYLQSWATSRSAALNRLAIYGWSHRNDVSADEKIEWLLQQDGWINDNRMHHEMMRLIAMTVPQAAESTIQALITQIAPDPEHRYPAIAYDKLGWIAHHAPSSTQARSAFAQAQAANPDWELFQHLDPPLRDGAIGGTVPDPDGICPQDLAESLTADPAAAAAGLLAVAARNMPLDPMPYAWAQVIGAVRQATRLSPRAGLGLLEVLAEAPDSHAEATRALASCALMELARSPTVHETARVQRDRIGQLLVRLWDVGTAHWNLPPGELPPRRGWLSEANESWPGNLALLSLRKISSEMHAAPNSWTGLPSDDKHLLENIIGGDSHEARLAEVACVHNLAFLYSADRHWTKQHILPLLDPAGGEQRAVRCWDSYVRLPRWSASEQLLEDGLMGHFLAFAQHPGRRGQDAPQGFAHFAAALCLATMDSPPEWLTAFSTNASDATRTGFIRATTRLLLKEDPEIRAVQWRRWMHNYWKGRLTGLPQNLTEPEASALADWVILVGDDYPIAVDLDE